MPSNESDSEPERDGKDGGQSDERLASAIRAVLEGVGAEISASFPGITRLGGQIVAALYLADGPRSMDALAEELGRSKSNIFTNLKALEGAGIVEENVGVEDEVLAQVITRWVPRGARCESVAYPDCPLL